ncbi:hypothetical protein KVV02_004790 [Mortierella alpina]|uniref:Uncharacterized protein n=1 Tax=Mortierella alpina TaxID=64518 RepID=A0A9P8A4S2_MORAP|nr:hypothetical protein KVV02_004790 [Mortierella alpina]
MIFTPVMSLQSLVLFLILLFAGVIAAQSGNGALHVSVNFHLPNGAHHHCWGVSAVASRWYFVPTVEGPIGSSSTVDRPGGPPVTVPMNQDWKCILLRGPQTKITMVSVVLCISLSDLSAESMLKSFRFVSRQSDMELANVLIEEDELRGVPKQDAVRLRLYKQILYDFEDYAEVSINLTAPDCAGTYQLHYIEMDYCNKETSELLLYDNCKPQLSIKVGCSTVETLEKTVTVHSHCVSRSGSYAATLCFHAGRAIVEVWDIAVTGVAPTPGTPQHLSMPSAWGSVPEVYMPGDHAVCMAISCAGSSVTFFTDGSVDPRIPFQLMVWTVPGIGNDGNSSPRLLSSRRPCSGLNGFLGFGAFVTIEDDVLENKCQRYLACDGTTVSVYSTSGDWSLLQTITLGLHRNLAAARNVITSARGRYFAWTGDKGIVSVWLMETAKHFIHIPLDDDIAVGSPVKFSRDGSLMAICSRNRGKMTIHQLPSGVKLGKYARAVDAYAKDEMLFAGDQLIVPSRTQEFARTVVCTRTMESIRTFYIHGGLTLQAHQLGRLVYSLGNGSVVSITKLDAEGSRPIHQSEVKDHELEVVFLTNKTKKFQSTARTEYELSLAGNLIVITITSEEVTGPKLYIPLDVEPVAVCVVFLQQSCKLLVVTDYLWVWDLPRSSESKEFALVQVWALRAADSLGYKGIKEAVTDHQEHRVLLLLVPSTSNTSDPSGDHPQETLVALTYPISERDNMPILERDRISQGIRGAVKIYQARSLYYRNQNNAVLQYLKTLVRPSSQNPVSCIVTLCRLWHSDQCSQFNDIIGQLLSRKNGTFDNHLTPLSYYSHWIPHSTLKDNSDPVAILMEKELTHPEALEAASRVIDYCVYAACRTQNLTFLTPVYGSLRERMAISPEDVHGSLKKGIIRIQNQNHRSFIVNNHIIAHPPRFRLRFWEPVSQPLHECGNPIMQLYVSPVNSPMANRFNREVFVASFDALWFRSDASTGYYNQHKATTKTVLTANIATTAAAINWWRVLSCIIQVKLQFRSHMHVECYVYNLEFFDNPAIAALVAYKWNTIGFSYWLLRFVYQCCYYILVLAAATLQIYSSEKVVLVGVFVAIITSAVVFIWLEVVQACHDWRKYHRSKYNALDVLAFTLPLGASIDQILDLTRTEPSGNVRPLSFSVLVVFLHMYLTPSSSTYFLYHTALINVAFTKGDDVWRLAWVESRLRYIEAAENMSYHIPGFREAYNWFPNEIYYTMTRSQWKKYQTQGAQDEQDEQDDAYDLW